jgi:hypothetical protein
MRYVGPGNCYSEKNKKGEGEKREVRVSIDESLVS